MFTTYSASAGSGKTTHLVADYIALCFNAKRQHNVTERPATDVENPLFRNVLGITFTNNAAAEMKDRIVKTLNAFAFTPTSQLKGSAKCIHQMVAENLWGENCNIDDGREAFIRHNSLVLLRNIVYDYARFTLTTIDSFFQSIIRSSALTLHLDLNYQVLINLKEFAIQAVDQLLNELSAGDELSKKILFLLENKLEDNGKINMDKELLEVLDLRYEDSEKNFPYLEKLRALSSEEHQTFINNWRKEIKQIPELIKEQIQSFAQEGQLHVNRMLEFPLNPNAPSLKTWFTDIVNDPFGKYRDEVESFFGKEGTLLRKKKLSDAEQNFLNDITPLITDCFNKIRDIVKPLRQRYLDLGLSLKHAEQLLLIFNLEDKMNEIKEQNNFFILSEANILIHNNIKNVDAPAIYDRVRYGHYFIDEFQDTSLMQWQNLLPLLNNQALANNNDVTLFGDVKQAIYRFRNGYADLFHILSDFNRLQASELAPQAIDKDSFQKKTLSVNYRSLKSVILFNNDFFKYYSEQLEMGDYYEDVCQGVCHQQSGRIQVFIENPDSKENNVKRTSYAVNQKLENYIQENGDLSISEMETLRAVQDALDRGYAFGDIAILYSGNDKCSRIANLMLKFGWNVVTERSLLLESAPETALIIATLQYLLQPNDQVAQAAILHHYARVSNEFPSVDNALFNIKDNNLFEDTLGKDIPIDDWRAQPLFLLVKEIIQHYKLDKLKSPFLVDFENVVLDYVHTRNGGLAQFLTWWRLLPELNATPTLTLPSKTNAITVTTIHKSKGLEYPVVILPYHKGSNRLKPVWTEGIDNQVTCVELSKSGCIGTSYEPLFEQETKDRKLDELNLLYVAHTRASEMLYVITKSKNGDGDTYGDYIHAYLTNNAASTHENGSIAFTQDTEDDRFFYAGDVHWKKADDTSSGSTKDIQVPDITLSQMSIRQILKKADFPQEQSREQTIGNNIHDFLAKLKEFPQTEAEIEKITAIVDKDWRDELRNALRNILKCDKIRPFFAPGLKCLNETTIMDNHGQERRPDRIVFIDNKVVVIDYKTGQKMDKYEEQINIYCNLLKQMGYDKVEGHLLYI